MPTDRLVVDVDRTRPGFALAVSFASDLPGITALFGPSGSGKTSLLRLIAGLDRPDRGQIRFDGTPWLDTAHGARTLPAHRRGAALVFQDGQLFGHLTVAGNLRFAARRSRRAGPALDEIVEATGVAPLLRRGVGSLSGGERQRVAIARALAARPQLLLLDEPLSALDRAAKQPLLALIRALPARFGLPVVLVSHQLDEIAQSADEVLAMRAGRLVDQGPAVPVLARLDPALTGHFEAGAVLLGQVAGYDPERGLSRVDLDDCSLSVPGDLGPAGTRARLRVRARDVAVALAPVPGLSIRNQLPATVTAIVLEEGAHAELSLRVAGQTLKARLTRAAVADLNLTPGQPVIALIKSVSFDRRLR